MSRGTLFPIPPPLHLMKQGYPPPLVGWDMSINFLPFRSMKYSSATGYSHMLNPKIWLIRSFKYISSIVYQYPSHVSDLLFVSRTTSQLYLNHVTVRNFGISQLNRVNTYFYHLITERNHILLLFYF